MAVNKSLQFLPEIFRTETNQKFLHATVDQLISEPNLKRVNGYIGRKLAPSYKSTDSYILESSKDRQNYQLESSIVIKNPVTEEIEFTTTYTDLINQISYHGGLSNNHDRLFKSEYYTYDPRIDFDKLINFSQYYWLENGPSAITVSASGVPLQYTFNVIYDSVTKTYNFTGQNGIPNPTISLARGGVYDFVINDPGNNFFIQTKPGASGVDPLNLNISTREIYGVTNNGTDFGVVRFTVPAADAQINWTGMPLAGTVDYATQYSYSDIQGCSVSDLQNQLDGLDGPTAEIVGKYLIFIDNTKIDDIFWNDPPVVIVDGIARFDHYDAGQYDIESSPYENVTYIPQGQKNDIFLIQVYPDQLGVDRIILSPAISIDDNQKIRVRAGDVFSGKEFYSNNGLFLEVPTVTAPNEIYYYQNAAINEAAGLINIVNPAADTIDPDIDIVGNKNYTSPQGIIFTNGLKVTFDTTVTESYQNKTYYVEGVGTSIRLILETDLTGDELDSNLSVPDYFTINRSSIDLNAWSRTNRWFHVDIITKTAEYLKTTPVYNQEYRAKRPIIEFEADLQLYNYGSAAKKPVQILDTVITNAFEQVQGAVCVFPAITSKTFTIGSASVTLSVGDRVVFANDENLSVKNKIYKFNIVQESIAPDPVVYKAYIEEEPDSTAGLGHVLTVQNGDNGKKVWYFNGTSWSSAQQKTKINQAPLFDIIDENGISLAGTSTYPGSSFTGTKIFSYKQGNGNNDPILGFPLSYKNFVAQGDIEFVNNFDADTFEYITSGGTSGLISSNTGLLQKNLDRTLSIRQNIWNIADDFSKQFQIYNFTYDGSTNLFPIDGLPDNSDYSPNIKVYINNTFVDKDNFGVVKVVDKYAVLINESLLSKSDSIFVLMYSSFDIFKNAYYEVPSNLDINGENENLNSLTLGQMRNHLTASAQKNLFLTGTVPGSSNLRDISYKNKSGSILQNSAPVLYASLFLSHPTMNFVNSLKFTNLEYSKFRTNFIDLATKLPIDRNDVRGSVDILLRTINEIKNKSFSFYDSDMIPYATMPYTELPEYTVFSTTVRTYELSQIFEDTKLQNKAVFVYLTRAIDNVTTTELLIKDQDFVFNQSRPAIDFSDNFTLLYGDKIKIIEYSDTLSSFVPPTPTKLGLYPKFIPQILTDDTYRGDDPVQVIQGHDGSITICFGDYRDKLLLELERRIFNNIKISYNTSNFNLYDHIPGKFRSTGYSLAEYNQIISSMFLTWAGTYKIDFTTNNIFSSSDQFTWNYKKFRDTVNGEFLPGSWRAVYRYFYDTERPHTHPWEMLGFSIKPIYWDDRYGPAPYTSGNSLLWSDLSLGYIFAGEREGFDIRYQRPNLQKFIPVDEFGNLISPADILVVDFDSSKANSSFSVGDIGPAESAWRNSCEYPYAVVLAMSLMRPAMFFSLFIDIENYNRNLVTSQFVIKNTGQHIGPISVKVNGCETYNDVFEYSLGYLNLIVDYMKNLGIQDAANVIKTNLSRLSTQLTYRVGGFTDKKLISLLAEQSSPTSINDSIVIPDENYRIELFKGAPIAKVKASALLIEKSASGWTVYGYDVNEPYFRIYPVFPNNNSYTITQSKLRGIIYKDFRNNEQLIPYGYEFTTRQQVIDFIVGYQNYLISAGFLFEEVDINLGTKLDWIISCKEFLHWSTQGWKSGAIIVLSPFYNFIKFSKKNTVVDEIKNISYGSKVLDINGKFIKKNNFTISREDSIFTLKSLDDQTIGFIEVNLVQNEHIFIIDNQTVFNDILYAPSLGNRQFRLKLQGSITAEWNGSLELPGFLYSSPRVEEWAPVTDYRKGTVIKHKEKLYTALTNVIGANEFQVNSWQLLASSEFKTGLINNLATNAGLGARFYDIDNQLSDENLQLFSNGIIGFRERNYFTDLGVDVTSQVKFYQGLLKQKGTTNAIIALKGAIFNNINTNIEVYENWAVRVGEYGALDDSQYIEIALEETAITNNPTPIQFIGNDIVEEANIVSYTFNDLYKVSGTWNPNILKLEDINESKPVQPLPNAGYVYKDDIDSTIFDLNNYSQLNEYIPNIGTGWKLWVAKDFNKDWNVLRADVVRGILFAARYTVDDQVEFVHNEQHTLHIDDLVTIVGFDPRFDGFYKVNTIIDLTRFTATLYQNLDTLIKLQTVVGEGLLYRLLSMRLSYATDLINLVPHGGWIKDDKVWIDNLDYNKNWGVYTKNDAWSYSTKLLLNESQYANFARFGSVLSISSNGLLMYAASSSASPSIAVFQKNTINNEWILVSFLRTNNASVAYLGQSLSNGSNLLCVGAHESYTNQGLVFIYYNQELQQILLDNSGGVNDQFGFASAMSSDGRFLYIGAPGANKIYCYGLAPGRTTALALYNGNGINTIFTLPGIVSDASETLLVNQLTAQELIPFKDYTVAQKNNGVTSFSFTGTPSTSLGFYLNVVATGGTGTNAVFDVTVSLVGPGLGTAFVIGKIYRIATPGTTDFVTLGAANNLAGTVFVATGTGITSGVPLTSGTAYTSDVLITRSGENFTAGDTLTIAGADVGGATPANNITISVTGVGNGTDVTLFVAPSSGAKIGAFIKNYYYQLLETLPYGTEATGSLGFGQSIATNSDGSVIVVGSPLDTIDGYAESGSIYIYHRTVYEFFTDGISSTYTVPDNFNTIRNVYLNDDVLVENVDYYILGTSTVQFPPFNIPSKSKKLKVETNQFVFDQKLSSLTGTSYNFGSVMDMCSTGCNIIVGTKNYNEFNYQFGAVSRIVNVARVYGTITGKISNPTVTPGHSLIINNYNVVFFAGTLASVVSAITDANIPGITAEIYQNKLKITSQVITLGNKLDVKSGVGTALDDLGIFLYETTQNIIHNNQSGERFGTSLSLNSQSNKLIVGSSGGDVINLITFDLIKTTFDNQSTKIVDKLKDSGAVYVFDLIDNPFQNYEAPSLFIQSQKLQGPDLQTDIDFGKSLKITDDVIFVGTANYNYLSFNQAGAVYLYANQTSKPGWELLRYQQPRVDINSVASIFTYDSEASQIVSFYDYIDPFKGKILGVVDQELDYKENFDPASYNTTSRSDLNYNVDFYWAKRHVGKIWWDLSQVRFIDYEQGSLIYRTNNWGALFPGSAVKIYEWVESDFLPSQYIDNGGNGIPKHVDNSAYTKISTVDPNTGIVVQKYYYWVGNKTSVNTIQTNRFLSTVSLESYISNPKNQEIPYMVTLAPNSIALFNTNDQLRSNKIILHIDLQKSKGQNLIHSEYELIRQGSNNQSFPEKIITKLRDSLTGFDKSGSLVPDISLNVQDRFGISFQPRQSMFVNRLGALKIFIQTANLKIARYPILLLRTPTTLYESDPIPTSGFDSQVDSFLELSYLDANLLNDGYKVLVPADSENDNKWVIYSYSSSQQQFVPIKIQAYKTDLFWTSVDWYDETFDRGRSINYFVPTYSDIQSLIISEGSIIKVSDNGNGQWLIYEVTDQLTLKLVAAQNATIIFNESIYNSGLGSGFDTNLFGTLGFDSLIGKELTAIFNSLYGEIFINDLLILFNELFFAMISFILGEQKQPDWIFKTSFIDVYHNLRKLEQISNYVKDDQTFYENYINDIKPYRTKLREYLPIYDNLDTATGDWTDFDLPSRYDVTESKFTVPDDIETLSTVDPYVNWYDNYSYKITDFFIGNVGVDYYIAPNVEITGGGGVGATAITTVNFSTQQLTGVVITNPGSGYTSTPTVKINGVGSGAIIYPILKNSYYSPQSNLSYNLVRTINSTLKFDRVLYSSDIVEFVYDSANIQIYPTVISGNAVVGNLALASGNIVAYNNEVFKVNQQFGTANPFDFTKVSKIDAGNILLKSVDRIKAYYSPNTGMPAKSYSQLMSGINYPGVKIKGPEFNANSFQITSNTFSFNYNGLTITSANISQVDFVKLGFELDQSIKIDGNYTFDFKNNGFFKIISVSRDAMTLSGEVIETTYRMLLDNPVTVSAGSIITQSNTLGNAFVLSSVTDSRYVDIIHSTTGFRQTTSIPTGSEIYPVVSIGLPEYVYINGSITTSNIQEIVTGGNSNVTISYLDLETSVLDSNIFSTYKDSSLGIRPEDINIVGGAYVDTYNSHAPEELIPGRMYDSLEMRVFTNASSTALTYGFRVFHSMNQEPEFTRISANNSTILTANLNSTDDYIFVTGIDKLPKPNPEAGIPGVISINGERIHYYQHYTIADIASAVPWQPNTDFELNILVNVDIGTFYPNVQSNVNGVNFDIRTYRSTYSVALAYSNVEIFIGNNFTINGNLIGGSTGINDATITVNTDGLNVFYDINGLSGSTYSTVFVTTGNVFANANTFISTSNVYNVYSDSVTQLRRGVDGTGIKDLILVGNLVSDTSRAQFITNSQIFSSNLITGNITTTANVTYRLALSSNITANLGDYITQFGANSGNARILHNVTNANVVAVDYVTGIFQTATNIATRINLVSLTSGISNSNANIASLAPLGSINSNGNVVLTSVKILQSNTWEQFSTTLENSTTVGAQFIRAEPSYIP